MPISQSRGRRMRAGESTPTPYWRKFVSADRRDPLCPVPRGPGQLEPARRIGVATACNRAPAQDPPTPYRRKPLPSADIAQPCVAIRAQPPEQLGPGGALGAPPLLCIAYGSAPRTSQSANATQTLRTMKLCNAAASAHSVETQAPQRVYKHRTQSRSGSAAEEARLQKQKQGGKPGISMLTF